MPGANSPKVFYNKLKNYDISWEKLSFMATDERIVPFESSDSNTGMLDRYLVSQVKSSIKPRLIDLYPKEDRQIEESLIKLNSFLSNNIPRIAFMGIGEDGHTAGVFSKILNKNNCYLLKNSFEPYQRITISLNLFLKVDYIIFYVLGNHKKKILAKILLEENGNDFLPSKYLLENFKGKALIICDKKSAPDRYKIGESIIKF